MAPALLLRADLVLVAVGVALDELGEAELVKGDVVAEAQRELAGDGVVAAGRLERGEVKGFPRALDDEALLRDLALERRALEDADEQEAADRLADVRAVVFGPVLARRDAAVLGAVGRVVGDDVDEVALLLGAALLDGGAQQGLDPKAVVDERRGRETCDATRRLARAREDGKTRTRRSRRR